MELLEVCNIVTRKLWRVYAVQDLLIFLLQYGPANQNQLAEACFVVNVLDPKVKKDLLAWFVKLQLSEYLVLFGEDQDVSNKPLFL